MPKNENFEVKVGLAEMLKGGVIMCFSVTIKIFDAEVSQILDSKFKIMASSKSFSSAKIDDNTLTKEFPPLRFDIV